MKRYYWLPIVVEVDDQDKWDASCDETHALMRMVNSLESGRVVNPYLKVPRAFLMRDYMPITREDFEQFESESMDAKGV